MQDPSDSSQPLSPPRGMRDFYPEEMALRTFIFDAWRNATRAHGFAMYDSCVVESLDLLKRKSGEEIVNQIYAFADKSGRELALRPEMTPTLARMVAARQGSLPFPLKWAAIGQCFRYERMSRGRKREHYQWNLDIIGEQSVSAEAEVLAAAARALRLMGLGDSDFRIRFSSRSLLSEILRRLEIAPEQQPAVFLALDKRGKIPDETVATQLRDAGLSREQAARVIDAMRISSIDEAAALTAGDSKAVQELRDFAACLEAHGLGDCAGFDISVIRGLAYYTGIVFEGFDSTGDFRAIFGGGRYDNLLAQVGGRPATGVGLGFGDVVVAEILAERGTLPSQHAVADIAVGFMTEAERIPATRLAAEFRAENASVDAGLAPEKAKAFFSRASRSGCGRAIYIGPDDVASGKCRVKNMADRTETDRRIPR